MYTVHCPDGPTLDCPFLIDPSGAYIRREGHGGHYICGASPSQVSASTSHSMFTGIKSL